MLVGAYGRRHRLTGLTSRARLSVRTCMLATVGSEDDATRGAGEVDGPDYEELQAALSEGLLRLRAPGLSVPPASPGVLFCDDDPPFAPELADAPPHPEEPR